MPKLVLPNVALTYPGRDYSQERLVEQLELYLALKAEKMEDQSAKEGCILPFDTINGLCSGLVSYWLYSKCIDEEGRFMHRLEYALFWDAHKFKTSPDKEDLKLEEFLNNAAFLHHDHKLRGNINQYDLEDSFELLAGEHQPKVKYDGFKLAFVFNRESLIQLILDVVQQNKMIRLDNGFHTIGLMYSGDDYYLYNPDNKTGPQFFNKDKIQDLVDSIFIALGTSCGSKEYLALSMVAFDIDDYHAGTYPDPIVYCKNLLQDPAYKQEVLQHNNIFHLGARCNDYSMLDLLFAEGYKYIPWTLNATTELEEAIIFQNQERLNYLIEHEIPLDYRTENGKTPLGRAIIEQRTNMLYTLLIAGADPNILATNKRSLLYVAILFNNIEAVTLLLASGMEVTQEDLALLTKKLPTDHLHLIIDHAIILNKKLLNLPKLINLDNATDDDIMAFLYHAKLMTQLEQPLDNLQIQDKNKIVAGSEALHVVEEKAEISKLNQILQHKPNHLLFATRGEQVGASASTTASTDSGISFTRDVLPLLRL